MGSRELTVAASTVLTLFLCLGCSQPKPPTLVEQTRAFPTPTAPEEWAVLGWWSYLSGDLPGARKAFIRSVGTELGRLGTARLARDRLDQSLVDATLEGMNRADFSGRISTGWRSGSAQSVPPVGLVGPISQLSELTLHALGHSSPKASQTGVTILEQLHPFISGLTRAQGSGLYFGVWTVDEPNWIRVTAPGRMVVWQGDVRLGEAARTGSKVSTVLGPLSGPIVVAWEGPGAVRLTPIKPPAAPLDAHLPMIPDRGQPIDWLSRYLNAEAARASGQFDAAWRELSDAPTSPAFEAIRAELFEADQHIPRHIAMDRAMEHWRRAVPIQPIRATLRLADLLRRSGRSAESLPILKRLLVQVPRAEAVYTTYLKALLDGDRLDDARDVFRTLETLSTDRCAHQKLRMRVFGRSRTEARRVAEGLIRCGKTLDGARHLLALGFMTEALSTLDGLKHSSYESVSLRIRTLLALGRIDEARALGRSHLDPSQHQLALDLSGAPLDDARAGQIRNWTLKQVNDPDALAVMATRPDWSPFTDLFLDTEAAIATFERSGQRVGRATRVLDHSVLYFTADGHSLRRVHEVLAISSRQAAEEFGELALPSEARAILVYTRKANGQLRFAEAIPEKEALSLPGLEAGDYLVAMYSEPGDSGYLSERGFLSQRAYFADLGIDIFRQHFDVIPPAGVPYQVEVSPEIKRENKRRIDTLDVLRFSRRKAPAIPVEPRTLDPALFLPSLRVGGGISLEESLDSFREQVLIQRRAPHDFRRFVRRATKDREGVQRLRPLLRAVRERYTVESGLVEHPVQRGLYDGRGHRALALSVGLEVLGVGHRLYLARPNHPRQPTDFNVVSDFQVPVIQTDDGTWIYPDHDSGAIGYLPFPLLGGDAIVVWPPMADSTTHSLPEARVVRDERRSTLRATWRADGVIEGEVEDVLTGQEAVSISGYLRQLEPSQRPRLVERLLVHVLSTARITHLEPPKLMGHDRLVLRYRFEARVGDAMNLGLFPMRPGRTFASLAARETPLYIDLPAHQRVEIDMRSERPITTRIEDADRRLGRHRFSRKVDASDDRIRMSVRLDIQGGTIVPKAYPDFTEWARAVDRLERVMIKRGPLLSRGFGGTTAGEESEPVGAGSSERQP